VHALSIVAKTPKEFEQVTMLWSQFSLSETVIESTINIFLNAAVVIT
jgi:hypothetical protein